MSDAIAEVEKDLAAADDFAALSLPSPTFNVSISGTWAGTITLQRSFNGQDWKDVATFITNAEQVGDDPEENIYYRIGFKAGEYTSGTASVRLSQ